MCVCAPRCLFILNVKLISQNSLRLGVIIPDGNQYWRRSKNAHIEFAEPNMINLI